MIALQIARAVAVVLFVAATISIFVYSPFVILAISAVPLFTAIILTGVIRKRQGLPLTNLAAAERALGQMGQDKNQTKKRAQ